MYATDGLLPSYMWGHNNGYGRRRFRVGVTLAVWKTYYLNGGGQAEVFSLHDSSSEWRLHDNIVHCRLELDRSLYIVRRFPRRASTGCMQTTKHLSPVDSGAQSSFVVHFGAAESFK